MEWISVEDRLPEDEGYYIVLINKIPFVSKWRQLETNGFDIYLLAFSLPKHYAPPTYWMPLPNPPIDKSESINQTEQET